MCAHANTHTHKPSSWMAPCFPSSLHYPVIAFLRGMLHLFIRSSSNSSDPLCLGSPHQPSSGSQREDSLPVLSSRGSQSDTLIWPFREGGAEASVGAHYISALPLSPCRLTRPVLVCHPLGATPCSPLCPRHCTQSLKFSRS